jgi:signal transduction histidine kinase/DNA-binding response OmpR family regulator/ligand-binding sensor domain-containing protein
MKKQVLLLCFVIVIIFTGNAQQLQFNSLTVKEGLSQHDVSSIIQDSEGFIWISTYDGLNRFDGYNVENFFHDNTVSSLSSNRILSLFEDQKKRIWIGTDGYGLNYYSLKKGTITRVSVPNNYEIINNIKQIADGTFLIATTVGLFKIIEKENEFSFEIIQSPLTGLNIKQIEILKNGNILFATDKGIWKKQNDKYSLIKGSDYLFFRTIKETSKGKIWAGGTSGLFQIVDNSIISKQKIINSNLFSIIEGTNNDLWITTFDNGLLRVNLNTMKVTKVDASNEANQFSLYNNPLNTIFKDASNTLWVSNKNGLLYTNLDAKNFKSLPIQRKGHIRTLFVKNDLMYYGFQADKFYIYSFETNSNEIIKLPEKAKPIKVDTLHGIIHLATTNGLYREKIGKKNEFESIPIFNETEKNEDLIITSFCKDMFGNQYFGTFKGLIYKTKNETVWIQEKLEKFEFFRNVRVFSLKVDYEQRCVWVGTISSGLFKINLDKLGEIISIEQFSEQMTGSYKIPNNSIWSFFQAKNGAFYIGTDTGLLIKKPNETQFQPILAEDVQNKKIMGIVADEFSNLWLSNSQGIIKYSPKTGESTRYNYFDGLLTNTFTEAVAKNSKNELFFGSISGINYFTSGELSNNLFPSKISFTELLVNNNKVKVDEDLLGSVLLSNRLNSTNNLEFNHKQNTFTIEFTSTNYANVKVNKYRYKLENYDEKWTVVDNSKRFASYSNIQSGNYKLLVEATNPDGQWSHKIRTLDIKIKPAPWSTWWAYLSYIIIIVAVGVTIFIFWWNREKLRTQIKLSDFKNEQEKEINEMKLIFFTDVAHEFKTPLSLIIGPLNDLIRGSISKEHKEFCYNILSRNTNRMMNLVNQLLDFRKVNSGVNILKVSRNDLCVFIKEISKSFHWQAKNSEISFNIISPESYFCHFDKDIIEKVIFNVLSNAFKYTPNKGTIEIEIKPTWREEIEYFIILIKDSGKGISQLDKKKIFQRHFHGKDRSSSGIGLHLAATLIKAHKGEINVLNSSLGGTEFMITLPVSSKAFLEDEFLSKDDIPINIPEDYVPGEIPETINDEGSDKEKILVVEDDYDLRKYLKYILTNDYIVYEAANGEEGLEIAQKKIPDIIITDVMMPEMNGIEMCKKIKKNTLISHIPVLMLTAKTGDEFYNKGLKVGAWDYIAKPFNSQQLLQKINNIIETRNSFRQHLAKGTSNKIENHYVSYDQKFVKNATEIIQKKMAKPNFTVEDLSEELGLSRMQLHRKLKALTGQSATTFINSIKIEKAVRMFDKGCDRVQEAMDSVGINSYAHFISLFKEEKGMTPSKYIEELKKISKNK